jgi:Rrf2 family protein
MKLSTRARYALRLMLELARYDDGARPVSLNKVAQKGALPRRYLEQLVVGLKRAGLIRGVSGKEGGYHLTRMPAEIKIGDIVIAAIGPINVVDCVVESRQCLKADVCECRLVYSLINRRINDVLQEYSLADMLDKKWRNLMTRQLAEGAAVLPAARRDGPTRKSGVKR